jgi:mRNA interferase RelE/StbE
MPLHIVYEPKVAKKDIPTLSFAIQKAIKDSIEKKLTSNPLAFSKNLTGNLNAFRCLRVGDYRIVFIANEALKEVKIYAIGHRKNIYEIINNRI